MIGYNGVKFDAKGQNELGSTLMVQLEGQGLRRRSGRRRAPPRRSQLPFKGWKRSSTDVILLQVIVSGLLMGAVYALFSSGLTLIWGMMNVVNFAHGDFVMLAMYVAFFACTLLHAGPLLLRAAGGRCCCSSSASSSISA